jgi:hypothetical protein
MVCGAFAMEHGVRPDKSPFFKQGGTRRRTPAFQIRHDRKSHGRLILKVLGNISEDFVSRCNRVGISGLFARMAGSRSTVLCAEPTNIEPDQLRVVWRVNARGNMWVQKPFGAARRRHSLKATRHGASFMIMKTTL